MFTFIAFQVIGLVFLSLDLDEKMAPGLLGAERKRKMTRMFACATVVSFLIWVLGPYLFLTLVELLGLASVFLVKKEEKNEEEKK